MIDVKGIFNGGLNLDDNLYVVPKDSYVDALNVTTDAIEGSNDRAITNVIGNNLVNTSLPEGRNKCIGACPNNVRNTVIYFVWNENGYHSVFEYDNNSGEITSLFQNLTQSDNVDVLGFLEHKKITSINIYNRDEIIEEGGDLLFFIDSLGRPTTMDIKRFRNEEYTPVTRDILDVCKKPPLFPPLNVYIDDPNVNTNNLRNRLFRFKYRYVYDNNEKSVCSPIGSLPLPVRITNNEFANDPAKNNRIDITLNTGDKDVKSVELLMSYVRGTNDWSDFALVENINKKDLFLKSKVVVIEDNPLDTNVKATITFSGVPIYYTYITISIKDILSGDIIPIGDYLVSEGDTISDVVNGLAASLDTNGIGYIGVPVTTTSNTISFYFDGAAYVFNNNFVLIELPNNPNIDNIPFQYFFYNDGTYPVIDVAESIQLFDYVPDNANAQEMPNGNVLLYGGITEGYDRTLNPNVVNTVLTKNPSGSQVDGLTGTASQFYVPPYTNVSFKITLSGIPIPGTVINVYINDNGSPNTLAATYLTLTGQSTDDVINGLYTSFINLGEVQNVVKLGNVPRYQMDVYLKAGDEMNTPTTLEIITPNSTDNSIPTFLFSTKRRIGIAYFDKKGKTNGILYSDGLEFPEYDENENDILLPYIKTQIYHKPPDWAYSYGFYLTKEATQFLYWKAIAVKSDTDYWYFNISNLVETQQKFPTTAQVLSYTFQDGDRMRLIKKESNGNIYTDKYDALIEGQITNPPSPIPAGTYIKIKKTATFTSIADEPYIIQLYRPVQQAPSNANEVYYEFGQQYGIGNPGEENRYHKGMLLDQGEAPQNPITADVGTTPFSPTINITRYEFVGVPVPNTVIELKITDLTISSQITLASYVVNSSDTLDSIVTSLYNILNSSPYNNLLYSSLYRPPNTNKFEFTYYSTNFIVNPSDTVFTYPTLSELPATFEFYNGDVYYRLRTLIGASSQVGTMKAIDRNFVDNYISAVNSVDGRPSVIDINAKKAYYSTLVRFGQAYQPNTNINGLNRFFPNNFDEYDYSYGDIMRFKVRDRFIRVFQKFKVGQVPLYAQILKEQNKENLVVTDRLLNPIQYYVGDLGIGEHAESLISYNFADYFTSNIKGIIGRVSNDGIKFLSIDHKVDSWATSNLPLRTGNYKVYGGLDQRLGNYIIALEATDTDPAVTLVYDLDLNVFSTFLSYHPEMMTVLGTLFISFKNGELWTHDSPTYNNFYGQQHDSTISVVFNQDPLNRKTFLSVSEIATQIWDVPQMNTDLNSYGNVKMQSNLVNSDFVQLEGNYEAPILRDANSIGGVLEGDSMKGKIMTMKFRASQPTSLVSLNLVSLRSINSPLNAR